jgi:hypothetical protein
MKDAKLEADLGLVNGVKEMTWVPTETNQSIATVSAVKKLKWYFQVKVKRYTGKIEVVTVSTDWVQTNFNKAVIGQVQRTAYEKLEELECTGQNLSAKNRRGFVSVKNCGVQISEIDKRVIIIIITHRFSLKELAVTAFSSSTGSRGARVERISGNLFRHVIVIK